MIINCDSIVARSFNEMPFHFCVIDEKSYFYINFMILGISMQLKSGEPLGGGRSPPSRTITPSTDVSPKLKCYVIKKSNALTDDKERHPIGSP